MKSDMRAILAIIIFAGSVPASDTLVLSGSVTATLHPYHTDSANKLHFLGKFCFSNVEPHTGQITIEAKVRAGAKGTHVLLFDDTKWPQVWASRESISCHEAVGRANSAAMQDELDWIDGLPIGVSRHSMQVNNIIRPHYWYAAAVNCNGTQFTFFTGTKVHILKQKRRSSRHVIHHDLFAARRRAGIHIYYCWYITTGICFL